MAVRRRIGIFKAAGIGRHADIDALSDIGGKLRPQRIDDVIQHFGTAACIRPDQIFVSEADVGAMVVDHQINLALVLFRRIREQLFLCNIGRYDIARHKALRRVTRHDQRLSLIHI